MALIIVNMTVHVCNFMFEMSCSQNLIIVLPKSETPPPSTQPRFVDTPKSELCYPSSPGTFTAKGSMIFFGLPYTQVQPSGSSQSKGILISVLSFVYAY